MPVKYDMTIDETIEYLEKTARNQLECAEKIDELGCDSTSTRSMVDYHNRLANWLRELVHLRNITEYLRDFIDCFGSMDSMYKNEDIIEWAESELRVDMREINADREGSDSE